MAASVFGTGSPHAAALSALLVGFPSFTAPPVGFENMRARKDPFRRIFSGVSAAPRTPGWRFDPVDRLYALRPASERPPLGFLWTFFRLMAFLSALMLSSCIMRPGCSWFLPH